MSANPPSPNEEFVAKVPGADPDSKILPPKWADTSFQTALDASPDAMLVIDRAGEIVAANLQAQKFYGYSRESLIGSMVESLVPARLRDRHRQHRENFFANPEKPMQALEIFALRGDASEVPVDVSLRLLAIESETFAISAIRDATDSHRMEELKRAVAILHGNQESEERFGPAGQQERSLRELTLFRVLLDQSNDAIQVIEPDTLRFLDFNDRTCMELGYSRPELLSMTVYNIAPGFGERERAPVLEQIKKSGTAIIERVHRRKDGTEFPVEMTLREVHLDRTYGVAVARDITQRKQAEQALASMNRRMIEAEEQERARIAIDLHENIGQRLALLANELEQLKTDFPDQAIAVRSRMDSVLKRTLEILTDVKISAHELHSPRLEYLGIAAVMRSFCVEFGERKGVEIDFRNHDLPTLVLPDVSLCLFRVLQDALYNGLNHSGAKKFEVQLWGAEDEIHLTVSDSGAGLEIGAANKGSELGLIRMEDRVKLVDGELSIESNSKGGTTIHARVPFSAGNESIGADG
jgi:PAS domain S-box-containing protein